MLDQENVTHVKPVSLTSLITEIPIGDTYTFSLTDANSIRAILSGRIKKKFPLKQFTTETTDQVVHVKRLEDKQETA